jgi:predicted ATPase
LARQVDADGPVFADAPVAERRVHFHEFMLEVQARLRAARLAGEGAPPEADTIVPIAREIAQRRDCSASTSSRSPTSPTR